jgi:peroxiredoxin
MLDPETRLPDFIVRDDRGGPVRSADFLSRWVVLWWYVEADTPG